MCMCNSLYGEMVKYFSIILDTLSKTNNISLRILRIVFLATLNNKKRNPSYLCQICEETNMLMVTAFEDI